MPKQVRQLEPAVRAVAGLLSPTTGIIDSHAYMLSLRGDLEAHGGMIALGTRVEALEVADGGILVVTEAVRIQTRTLINCAGLQAPDLARQLVAAAPRAFFARGHYFGYSGRPPFSRLVYPIAEPGGLGVHVTVDLSGQIKVRPRCGVVRWRRLPV